MPVPRLLALRPPGWPEADSWQSLSSGTGTSLRRKGKGPTLGGQAGGGSWQCWLPSSGRRAGLGVVTVGSLTTAGPRASRPGGAHGPGTGGTDRSTEKSRTGLPLARGAESSTWPWRPVCLSLCSGSLFPLAWMELSACFMPQVKVLTAQLCLTLCNPRDCGPPGSSIHGTSQARILEWAAISFSTDDPRPWLRQTESPAMPVLGPCPPVSTSAA